MPRKTPKSTDESSIDVLLREERQFRPGAVFRRRANVRDASLYRKAARDPEAFWAACSRDIVWLKPWKKVLAWNPPRARWFVGGKLNASVNCLDRHLETLRTAIARHDLTGLEHGLEWLKAKRPPEPAALSILHLDFHPLNLIVRPDGSLAVLDWTYADLGDPHADVATSGDQRPSTRLSSGARSWPA